jgi:hypothetical protein
MFSQINLILVKVASVRYQMSASDRECALHNLLSEEEADWYWYYYAWILILTSRWLYYGISIYLRSAPSSTGWVYTYVDIWMFVTRRTWSVQNIPISTLQLRAPIEEIQHRSYLDSSKADSCDNSRCKHVGSRSQEHGRSINSIGDFWIL